jgi:hypothetical protein
MGGSLRQLLRGEFWLKPKAKSNRENIFYKRKNYHDLMLKLFVKAYWLLLAFFFIGVNWLRGGDHIVSWPYSYYEKSW